MEMNLFRCRVVYRGLSFSQVGENLDAIRLDRFGETGVLDDFANVREMTVVMTVFFLLICATVGISTSTPPTSSPAKAALGSDGMTSP